MPPNGKKMRESTAISSHNSVAADYSSVDALRKLVRQTNKTIQHRKSRRQRQKLKQLQSISRQSLSSGGIVAGEHEAGSSYMGAKSSTIVVSQANEESGRIKKDALDLSFQAMIDDGDEDIVMTVDEAKIEQDRVQLVAATSNKSEDSETAAAHPRRKLIPIRGGLKSLRALRSSAGTRVGAAVVPAAPVSRESSPIEVEAVEKPPQFVRSRGAWKARRANPLRKSTRSRYSEPTKSGSENNPREELDTIVVPSSFTAVNKPGTTRTTRKSLRSTGEASKEARLTTVPADGSNSVGIELHSDGNDGWVDGHPVDKVLISPIVKTVLGNSGASTTYAKIGIEGIHSQIVSCEGYFLVSQEYHPDCPTSVGKNRSILEISGAEDLRELDHDKVYPVFLRYSKLLVYLGNYKLREREIMPVDKFEKLP
ncbi:hypothetical protein RUND412_009078 [Rhizina undulata]